MAEGNPAPAEEFRIDPKDFIHAPYRACEKCGKQDSFGVLMIGARHYVRRCRACWYTVSLDLPELHKKILYLDQFAISNMMKILNPTTKERLKGTEGELWLALFSSIDRVCKLQLLVCPDSEFHSAESVVSPFSAQLKRMYELLSGGASFYDYETVTRFQVHEHVQSWVQGKHTEPLSLMPDAIVHGQLNAWQDSLIISVDVRGAADLEDSIRKAREEVHKSFSKTFEAWQKEKRPFEFWFTHEAASYGRSVVRAYLTALKQWDRVMKGDQIASLEAILPSPAVLLVHTAQDGLKKAGVGDSDLWQKTMEYFLSDAVQHLPFNRIAAALCAGLAVRAGGGQKELPSRGMVSDLRMLSALLPYCDAVLIDNQCRSLLEENAVREKCPYACKVFSTKSRDALIDWVKGMEAQASPDHLAKVREVYGEDCGKPFTTLYLIEEPN